MRLPFCTSRLQSVFRVVRRSENVYGSPGMLYNIKDIILIEKTGSTGREKRMSEIEEILEAQHKYFYTGEAKKLAFRIAMLKRLEEAVIRHEKELLLAL